MTMLETDFHTAVLGMIDDPTAAFWTTSNLTTLIAMTMDEKWGQLLNFAPFYRSTLEVITGAPKLNAAGYINIPSLANRFYRIQSIVRDGRTLDAADPRDIQMYDGEHLVGPSGTYAFYGDQIYMFPISASDPLELRYSSLPTAFTRAGTAMNWPDGHESCLMYECAARAFLKGEREENVRLKAQAAEGWDNLLSGIKRRNFPLVPFDYKSSVEFGGT